MADVARLTVVPPPNANERARRLMEWSREIAIKHRPNMEGFVVLAWNKDGSTSICMDTVSPDNPIPSFLLPSWVAEHVRAEIVTAREVRGVLRDVGLLAPEPPDPA